MNSYAALTDEALLTLYYEEEDEEKANEAFAELDRRYRPRLILSLTVPGYNKGFVKLRKMPGLEQKGEELAAETLFKVADTRGRPSARWDPTRKGVQAWIFGIHHNVAVSFLRRRQPNVRLDSDFQPGSQLQATSPALDAAPDAAVGPEEALQNQALLAVLRECVQELPEQLRLLCELLFEKGMKQNEAAVVLKLSTPTVTRRKQEVCARLRQCLRRKGLLDDVLD